MDDVAKLPIGISDFSEIPDGYLYADKTGFILKLTRKGKFVFLARPPKFGKTLLISTLKYLFEGKKQLFKNLKIYENWDWLEKYPVLILDFNQIPLPEENTLQSAEQAIAKYLANLAKKYGIVLHQKNNDLKLLEIIRHLAEKRKIVILIDNYDSLFLKTINRPELLPFLFESHKNLLAKLPEIQDIIKFCLITGITQSIKNKIFETPEIFQDLTFSQEFNAILGFTQEETKEILKKFLFHRQDEHKEEKEIQKILNLIRLWYGNYNWATKKESIINPFSFLYFLETKIFSSYWWENTVPDFITKLINPGLLDFFLEKSITTSLKFFSRFEPAERISLLFNYGLLTIAEINTVKGVVKLKMPNFEVKETVYELLLQKLTKEDFIVLDNIINSLKISIITDNYHTFAEKINHLLEKGKKFFPGLAKAEEHQSARLFYLIIKLIFGLLKLENIPFRINKHNECFFSVALSYKTKNKEKKAWLINFFATQGTIKQASTTTGHLTEDLKNNQKIENIKIFDAQIDLKMFQIKTFKEAEIKQTF